MSIQAQQPHSVFYELKEFMDMEIIRFRVWSDAMEYYNGFSAKEANKFYNTGVAGEKLKMERTHHYVKNIYDKKRGPEPIIKQLPESIQLLLRHAMSSKLLLPQEVLAEAQGEYPDYFHTKFSNPELKKTDAGLSVLNDIDQVIGDNQNRI